MRKIFGRNGPCDFFRQKDARRDAADHSASQVIEVCCHVSTVSAIGSPETVARQVDDSIARIGADELMVTSQILDHVARLYSYSLTGGMHALSVA